MTGSMDNGKTPLAGSAEDTRQSAFRQGRIISPGTSRQLGVFGLFPPPTGRHKVVKPTNQPLTAKIAEPELLWISFEELCGGLSSTEDYLVLAAAHSVWVIDGVPSAAIASPAASVWQRFSNVVDVLHDKDITLFLVGAGPFNWDAAPHASYEGSTLPVDMARIAGRLSLLERIESEEELPDAESASC